MDPVPILMDPVHGPGPRRGSMDQGSMFCTFPCFRSQRGYFYPGEKFDRGRFWSCARQPLLSHELVSRNQQINTMTIVIFIKLHLNTWLPLSLKLTFSSQNHYQKISRQTACLCPCPSGKEGEKVTCPKEKSTCPGWPDGVFFEPC